ncbi:hypothetical protein [Niveispirillum fermenti]|uniref:hypothetical protein n=1 Tax=Niveispirillum fermenti TaxID=1233113 RepID=UPI003A841056
MNAVVRPILFASLLLLPAMPAWAQQPTSPPAEVTDEVIVTAPRNGEPDFQESLEYHEKEYRRLQAKFGAPPSLPPRGDQVFGMGGTMTSPNDRSDARQMIESAPRLRDTLNPD